MLTIDFNPDKQVFNLSNNVISYIMKVDQYNILTHIYFGKAITHYSGLGVYPRINRDFEVNFSENGLNNRTYSIGVIPQEYGDYGRGDFREPAIVIQHDDGAYVSDFRYRDYEIIEGVAGHNTMPAAYVTDDSEAKTLIISMFDEVKNLELKLYYSIFEDKATLTRSAELINHGEQTVSIEKMMSYSMDLTAGDYDLVQLNGAWARERMLEREPIGRGIRKLDSKRGTSSHHQSPFMAVVAPETDEDHGDVLSVQLVYSGNFELTVEQDPYDNLRIQAGIQSLGFSWKLLANESFHTPEVTLTYSAEGFNGMTQAQNDFIKDHIIPRRFKELERPILINNWEATYFDFSEEKIKSLVDQASDLGIELFVLDDGWFGRRDSDTSSLGDWFEHQDKLPHGLSELSDYVHKKGMQFGLWFEPEMISEDSELFRAHPDWALQLPDRNLSLGRDQYVLDFSRKDVRENIFEQMVAILSNIPIDYVKWDMNRHMSEVYSLILPKEQAGEVAHRYMIGLYQFLSKLTQAFPDILFESCSGGGGRYDLGMMQYMPQVWTSDNTDPVERLKIQYGSSLMAPLSTMGAHVSASPNHQTGRDTSLKMRGDVASIGVFGYELDLNQLTESDRVEIKQQVEFYKRHRQLIQQGRFTRLISPFETNRCAWSVDLDDELLIFYYEILTHASKPLQKITLNHLDKDALYTVYTEDEEFEAYGDELMALGIIVNPVMQGDFQSRVYRLKKQKA